MNKRIYLFLILLFLSFFIPVYVTFTFILFFIVFLGFGEMIVIAFVLDALTASGETFWSHFYFFLIAGTLFVLRKTIYPLIRPLS